MSKLSKYPRGGFTLIEVLVVVLIIGILAAIALPQYKMAVLKTKLARAKQTVSDMRKAYEMYYLVNGVYPTKFSELDFASKFDDSNIINMGDYTCKINDTWKEIICSVDNRIEYYFNFYTSDSNRITVYCSSFSIDTADIYNRVCQQDTGRVTPSYCSSSYCTYSY